jgi:predicted nucleic acid-binding protein
MKAVLDLNVLLDVVQNRHPHYSDSAAVLSRARSGDFLAFIPAHALTTIFYLIERAANAQIASQTIDWLLQYFDVLPLTKSSFLRARSLPLNDFEDGVVAAVADIQGCDYIVSRNVTDFAGSPVQAVLPGDFLLILQGVITPTGHPALEFEI